jgi:hypothetical protein
MILPDPIVKKQFIDGDARDRLLGRIALRVKRSQKTVTDQAEHIDWKVLGGDGKCFPMPVQRTFDEPDGIRWWKKLPCVANATSHSFDLQNRIDAS